MPPVTKMVPRPMGQRAMTSNDLLQLGLVLNNFFRSGLWIQLDRGAKTSSLRTPPCRFSYPFFLSSFPHCIHLFKNSLVLIPASSLPSGRRFHLLIAKGAAKSVGGYSSPGLRAMEERKGKEIEQHELGGQRANGKAGEGLEHIISFQSLLPTHTSL